jgi:uncharacterized membrane protein YfcA
MPRRLQYHSAVHAIELLTLAAGVVAGFLGALMGISGGVILVPLLNGVIGLPFREATGVTLVSVLAASGSAATAPAGRRLLNPRLAIFLLLFSVTGATLSAKWLTLFSERTYEVLFGATMATVAALMFVRLNRRNVLPQGTTSLGVFGDVVWDADTSQEVAYRPRRLPLAAAVAGASGMLASLIGIGGGIVNVPVLNALCGVPMRVAAATSVLMIGVTAVPGVVAHWSGGFLGDFHLAAASAVGVLIGFQVGVRLSPRAPVKWLKISMASLMTVVAIEYLFLR